PAVMMTKVEAIASTPLTAVDCRMPSRLSSCMKAGEAKLKKPISRIRLANANSFWRAFAPKSWGRKAPPTCPLVSLAATFVSAIPSFLPSGRLRLLAPCGQLHDPLLGRVLPGEFAGDAPLAHHNDAIAHAQDLRQFRRYHHNRLALVGKRAQQFVDLGLG